MPGYFDYAATTPMPEAVIDAWVTATRSVGNASATHRQGQQTRLLWEQGREMAANSIGAKPFDVTMTGSGTEAINTAIKGLYASRSVSAGKRILSTETEHHATLDTLHWLEKNAGAEIVFLKVDETGTIDLPDLAENLGSDVALVTTLWTNNEVGTIQPVEEIVSLAAEHGVPVHLDAVAALGYTPINFDESGLAALSVSAHKVGGPISVGALAISRGWQIEALVHGGSQQRLRSGSLDVPGVYAAGVAMQLATTELAERNANLAKLRDRLADGVLSAIPGAKLRGHPVKRSPGNLHITVGKMDSVSALLLLDEAGFAVSGGSACQAGVAGPSHVLRAMGIPADESPLRFTLGHDTTEAEVDELIATIGDVVKRASA